MPKIIVRKEGALVATFTVHEKTISIGSAQNCQVAIEDVGLPPQAGEITTGESGYTLKRLSPIPDLRINLERVDQFASLEDGDEIKLDDYSLIFNLLAEELPADESRNAARGRVQTVDSSDNVLVSTGPVVSVVGVDSLVVVATPDAVLVIPKEQAQRVKEVVDELRDRGWDDVL